MLEKDYQKSSALLKDQVRQETHEEMVEMKNSHAQALKTMDDEYKQDKLEIEQKLNIVHQEREKYYNELQKFKGQSNNLYEGGFGTFTLAFENPFYKSMTEKQAELQSHKQNMEMLRQSMKGKKKKRGTALAKAEEVEAQLQTDVDELK